MNISERLLDSIDKIDDSFLVEAQEYTPAIEPYKKIMISIAGIAAALLVFILMKKSHFYTVPVSVYAYSNHQKLNGSWSIIECRTPSPDGITYVAPFGFYILSDDIEEVDISCKNRWLSYLDDASNEMLNCYKALSIKYNETNSNENVPIILWHINSDLTELMSENECLGSNTFEYMYTDEIHIRIHYKNKKTRDMTLHISINKQGNYSVSVSESVSSARPTGTNDSEIGHIDLGSSSEDYYIQGPN